MKIVEEVRAKYEQRRLASVRSFSLELGAAADSASLVRSAKFSASSGVTMPLLAQMLRSSPCHLQVPRPRFKSLPSSLQPIARRSKRQELRKGKTVCGSLLLRS